MKNVLKIKIETYCNTFRVIRIWSKKKKINEKHFTNNKRNKKTIFCKDNFSGFEYSFLVFQFQVSIQRKQAIILKILTKKKKEEIIA